jgi:hypothetical protein
LRVVHLGESAVGWAGRSINEKSARVSPVPSIGVAAVCACCVSFQISNPGFRDALTEHVDVYPLQPNFCGGGLSAGPVA